jgi:hypothetical protein
MSNLTISLTILTLTIDLMNRKGGIKRKIWTCGIKHYKCKLNCDSLFKFLRVKKIMNC